MTLPTPPPQGDKACNFPRWYQLVARPLGLLPQSSLTEDPPGLFSKHCKGLQRIKRVLYEIAIGVSLVMNTLLCVHLFPFQSLLQTAGHF